MEFIKKSLTLNPAPKKSVSEFGVDGDIIVPDVFPDILKVLQVDGSATVTSSSFVGGKLNCEGRVDLKILYIPEDDNSKIKSIITSFNFTHSIGNAPGGEGSYADLSADVSKVDFQLINSRKLRIKTVTCVDYVFMSPTKSDIATEADGEHSLEIKRNMATVYDFVGFKDAQFLVRESLEIPAGQSSVCDLLKADASVYETEYKVMSDRVVLKGICGVCVLYSDSSGCVRYSDFEMPFTEIIELEGATEDTICNPEYCIKELTYRAEADSDGDVRIIVADALVGVKIEAYQKTQINYIHDCYIPGKCLNMETELKNIECIVGEGNLTSVVRDVITPDKTSPALSGIYNLAVRPLIEQVKPETGRVCVEGKLICYCLYICDGDEVPVYNTMREIRFCENVDIDGCTPECNCDVKADVTHKNFALNSAGETEIKITTGIYITVSKQMSIPVIMSCDVCETPPENKKGIVIYFVQPGDCLWDIAKKYTVPVSSITELNGLESDEICDGMRLLIPSV